MFQESQGAANKKPGDRFKDGSSGLKVRKNFDEVFLFEDIELTSKKAVISRSVTDAITTYIIFGVSMNENGGMGLSSTLPSATIFLPFFISLELPPSVKRGETLSLQVQVFNYLGSEQSVTLTVNNDTNFKAVDAAKNGWTASKGKFSKVFKVPNGDAFTAPFTIQPVVAGVINFQISAKCKVAGDAIEKPLRVIPEGVARSITSSVLVAVDGNTTRTNQTLKCDLPASAFNDTAQVSATIIGDILGKALNNLEHLISMPGGCGEQTMIGFVPDYAVLVYLDATNQLTPSLSAQLLQYLTAGYQNQLNYQRYDGSFSAFGNSDPSGSTWLSAYVGLYFQLASDYITISPSVIQNALNFIINQQNANGSFNEPGRVIHSDMQEGTSNGIGMTAYVTIALSVLLDAFPYATANRDLAVQYLEQQLPSINDTYALAVIGNALQLAGSASASSAYTRLFAERIETATEIHWAVPSQINNYGANSLDIEVTSYALNLIVARNAGLTTSLKVVKYLMAQSNSFGGYSSTQDTAMALTSLSNFALAYTLNQANLNLVLTPNAGTSFTANVNGNNSLTLQTFSLNSAARRLNISTTANSTGVAVISLICNFYEDPNKVVPSFNFTYNFDASCQWRLQMQICVHSINGSTSGMAIMEVRMPSGYFYYEAWWIRNSGSDVSKIETYEGSTVIVFYLNSVSNNGTCVTFGAGRTFEVFGLKPGSIVINDYYDTCEF
jgi:CD109 antigen